MTDRELLEDAAKAAGVDIEWQPCGWAHDNETGREWSPLTDDGDALRLAVKLAIDFKIRNEATWWDHQESEGVVYWSHEPHNGDPLAATRRAIVRAAAEIGKGVARPVNDGLPEDNYYKSMAEAEEAGRAAAELGRSKE